MAAAAISALLVLGALGARAQGYDVILVIGQSNAVGNTGINSVDAVNFDTPDPDILALGHSVAAAQPADLRINASMNGLVITAHDPLEHAETWNNGFPIGPAEGDGTIRGGVGFALSFAKLYKAAAGGRKVLIVGCAYSGSGFSTTGEADLSDGETVAYSWGAGAASNLLTNAVRRANAALAYDPAGAAPGAPNPHSRLAAVLWHQGEADVTLSEEYYLANLRDMVDALRRDVRGAADAPFLCAGLSPTYFPEAPAPELVQSRVGDSAYFGRARCAFASSRAPTPLSTKSGENIHFDAAGQRQLGARYFAAYLTTQAAAPREKHLFESPRRQLRAPASGAWAMLGAASAFAVMMTIAARARNGTFM